MLRKRSENVSISRTMKRKSHRGKFFVEPTKKVIKILKEIRNEKYIER